MAAIILWVLNHLSYWVIFVGMAIESSFIPFPSEAVVPPAAWLAQQGTLDIVLVVVVATLGADLGGLINYALAYWLGRPVIYRLAETRWAKMLLIDREAIEKSERFFRHHGVVSTLVGRLVPGVRQLISIPAGLSRMHLGKFLLYTTLGAGAWNCVLAFLGFYVIPTAFPDLRTGDGSRQSLQPRDRLRPHRDRRPLARLCRLQILASSENETRKDRRKRPMRRRKRPLTCFSLHSTANAHADSTSSCFLRGNHPPDQ